MSGEERGENTELAACQSETDGKRGEVTEGEEQQEGKRQEGKGKQKGLRKSGILVKLLMFLSGTKSGKNYRSVLTAHSVLHHLFSHLSAVQAIHLMRLSNCPIDDCLSIKPQQNHHYSACCFVMMCARQSVRERKRGKEG